MANTDTVCVLALDAADYELAIQWECENILLDNYAELETYAHTKDVPYTPEVWATVATGLGPADHGITGDAQDWDNLFLNAASRVTRHLPRQWRRRLGKPFRDDNADEDDIQIRQSTAETMFDTGEVWLWPGIADAPHLIDAWRWMREASDGELTDTQLQRNLLANTGREFGWLTAMSKLDVPIAGVHSHVLDTSGHIFADRPDTLREYYLIIDEMVGELRENCDRLVILSDHGIQTPVTNDDEVGRHSMRAMVSVQGLDGLSETVYDVSDWLAPQIQAAPREDSDVTGMDTRKEHLKDLGYM